MAIQFRKSIGKGPFRATLSKGGISTSMGVPGARVSRSTKWNGQQRTTRTLGIPGTGLYDTKTIGQTPIAQQENRVALEHNPLSSVVKYEDDPDAFRALTKQERFSALSGKVDSLNAIQLGYRSLFNKMFSLPLLGLVLAVFVSIAMGNASLVFAMTLTIMVMPFVQGYRWRKRVRPIKR